MVLYLFIYIIFIFTYTPELSESKCVIMVTQPQEHLHGRFNQSITISCHFNTSCQKKNQNEVRWYVFRTDSYYQLDIKNQAMKYVLQEADLHINWLSHIDDGVYYCAVFDTLFTGSGAQAIGNGTTLTVKGNEYNAAQIMLLTLVVLLSLYILIILVFFICIKTGRVKPFKRSQSQRQGKGDSTRRVHFGAVVQELYSKRNLRKNKKKTSTEVSPENKAPQSRTQKEDIYQNLKRAR